jgi:O-antigen ligase
MIRLAVTHKVAELIGAETLDFGHPHNAYLELVLDNGLLGGTLVLAFFIIILLKALRHFNNKDDKEMSLSAGFAVSFLITQAIAGLGSQSFYPTLGTVPMWSAIGVFLGTLYYIEHSPKKENEKEEIVKKRKEFYPGY